MVFTAAAGRPLRGRRGQPQHGRSAARGGYLYLGNGLADDIPHYWVQRLREPPRPADAALLLPLRRPVLSDVPAQGDRPRTSGCTAAQLARRVCRPIPAWPLFPHDLAPATHRLVQPAANAR